MRLNKLENKLVIHESDEITVKLTENPITGEKFFLFINKTEGVRTVDKSIITKNITVDGLDFIWE